MPEADDSPDGGVYDAADQLRHDLFTPLTTISARAQLLARDIRRSPTLAEEERTRVLVGITAIATAVATMSAVIDAIKHTDRGR
jgi:signal transduction histidine kinase